MSSILSLAETVLMWPEGGDIQLVRAFIILILKHMQD